MTKRRQLVREVEAAGLRSEGGTKHETFVGNGRMTRIPYHREIRDEMADVIRKQAGITKKR